MKKILLILFAFVINFAFALTSFAENFYITNYDVELDIQKNKDILVTEYIEVYFTKPSHGIFRSIPTRGSLNRNGQNINYSARISNVRIDEQYSTIFKSDSTTFKIGDPNRKITGKNDYTIQYKYSMGKDDIKDNDELYFNIIGTEWNTHIQRVNFKVNFPEQEPMIAKTTGFSIGRRGVRGYNPNYLKYSVKDNKTIVGYITRPLTPREGLTIRTLLPENYFKLEVNFFGNTTIPIIMLVLTAIAFSMWFIFGRDEKVIPVVNFYPPKNKNSAEVGVEYNGMATQKEISSLVMYLANKGYLEIEDDGVSYTLNKLKDYDGKNPYERRLMIALFSKSDTVTIEELQYSNEFYKQCTAIVNALNKIKNHLFDKNANSIEKMIILVVCILGLLGTMVYTLGDYSFYFVFSPVAFVLLFPIVGTMVVSLVVYNIITSSMLPSQKVSQGIFITLWGSMFILVPTFVFIIPTSPNIGKNYPVLLLGLACIIVSVICLFNMPKRNKRGRLALGNILGFKQFLEVAERNRLESLLAENRNYASDILPYAYVLGVSDKIIPILESSSLYSQPTWYKGHMTPNSFSRFGETMSAATVPSVSNGGVSHSSSGGSGFSGGGSSGGGGGGGGGGSW
ncbi:MAG: DUF2207 domain-containing protein [Candidatus Gastranaerophilales bacterium]|nr:DUF2207 domain-containing protein [Candidatus Gastranaerophilales bacterium]